LYAAKLNVGSIVVEATKGVKERSEGDNIDQVGL